MTRGGKRPGAGRPRLRGEKRTANLAGVHVTPTQLEAYKTAAGRSDMSLTAWVEQLLDAAAMGDGRETSTWMREMCLAKARRGRRS